MNTMNELMNQLMNFEKSMTITLYLCKLDGSTWMFDVGSIFWERINKQMHAL